MVDKDSWTALLNCTSLRRLQIRIEEDHATLCQSVRALNERGQLDELSIWMYNDEVKLSCQLLEDVGIGCDGCALRVLEIYYHSRVSCDVLIPIIKGNHLIHVTVPELDGESRQAFPDVLQQIRDFGLLSSIHEDMY